MSSLSDKTIQDFGDQWSKYVDNEGWYGSLQLFEDITAPLLDLRSLAGKTVVDIGSGTGRIVGMLLAADVAHVVAIEPSSEAFDVLKRNVKMMERSGDVTCMNERGDSWDLGEQVDYVFSIGVIHHIPDPIPVTRRTFEALKPGGFIFIWVYGYEGNELYLKLIEPIRKITTRLPHALLRVIVELMYGIVYLYRSIGQVIPLPLLSYIEKVLWPMSPKKRRLVIYDQLNPAYAKYYRKHEAVELLENAGFINVKAHQRHGYSWSVIGQKPFAQATSGSDA
jgi:SAM-dependent methyltransferase